MRWRGIRSQNQLARLSGVPQSSIHRILARGRGYAPERRTIDRLATALGTTPHWLSDGVQTANIPPLPSDSSEHLAELDCLLSRLAPADVKKLLEVVRLIAPPG